MNWTAMLAEANIPESPGRDEAMKAAAEALVARRLKAEKIQISKQEKKKKKF